VRWGAVHGNRPHGSELHWLIGGACHRPWVGDIAVALAVEDESKSVARLAAGVRSPGDGRYGTSVGERCDYRHPPSPRANGAFSTMQRSRGDSTGKNLRAALSQASLKDRQALVSCTPRGARP